MSKEQKVAIVTGASQGIGAGLVQGYRDAGYAVVANSRSIKSSSDEGVVAVAGDIGERATAERVVETALQRFGRIDTLVKTKSPQLMQQPFVVTEQELRAIHTIYPVAQALMRGDVHLPNRQSMLCSRRHCAYWRHCEQKWGGEVPET